MFYAAFEWGVLPPPIYIHLRDEHSTEKIDMAAREAENVNNRSNKLQFLSTLWERNQYDWREKLWKAAVVAFYETEKSA